MMESVSSKKDAEARRAEAHSAGRHPPPISPGRSRNMQAIRRTDTKPEVMLRSALHRAGYRFRKDYRIDAGGIKVRPDIVFPRQRVAVFVDGCFWHGCPVHGRQPKVNDWYWGPKLARTKQRDDLARAVLTAEGWRVLRAWEHQQTTTIVSDIEQLLHQPA